MGLTPLIKTFPKQLSVEETLAKKIIDEKGLLKKRKLIGEKPLNKECVLAELTQKRIFMF